MGLETITELLGLPGYFVKDIQIERNKIFLTVDRQGYPVCPRCGQKCHETQRTIGFRLLRIYQYLANDVSYSYGNFGLNADADTAGRN